MPPLMNEVDEKADRDWVEVQVDKLIESVDELRTGSTGTMERINDELSGKIAVVDEELRALQKIATSKDRVVNLEKAMNEGIGTLRHALSGKVEKAQLEQAITQMNQMRDETAKVEALKQGLTLVAKELTKKADAESLQMVESVICQLEQAKPQAAFGRRQVAGMCLSCNQEIQIKGDLEHGPSPYTAYAPFQSRMGSDPQARKAAHRSTRYYKKAPLYEGVDTHDPRYSSSLGASHSRSPGRILPLLPKGDSPSLKNRRLVPIADSEGSQTAR